MIGRAAELWGTEAYAASHADDQRFRRWSARLQRAIASPQLVRAHLRAMLEEEFPVWARRGLEPTRVLATVLFTDIVGSTERAAELGDRGWRDLLDTHDELAGRLVERWGGRLVKTTGDGILAIFDGPGRAIGCAATLRDELRGIGTQIRPGLHAGEVELRGDDVGGIAVNIAARIMATANAGEIVVSRTVRDLVAGSDVVLQDRDGQQLRGVGGEWELFGVVSP